MGTDIHMSIETKQLYNGEWSRYLALEYMPRVYLVFEELAGVRLTYNVTRAWHGRGLPADSWSAGGCDSARGFHIYGEHSHTWLARDEYARALANIAGLPYEHKVARERMAHYELVLTILDKLEAAGHSARVVVGFDS